MNGLTTQATYWTAATRLIENKHEYRAKRGRECPICGSTDWCVFDEEAALCPRSEGTNSPKQYGEFGYFHWLRQDFSLPRPSIHRSTAKPRPKAAPRDWGAIAERCGGKGLDLLTESIGVPKWALAALDVGWDGRQWIVPERDGDRLVVGLSTRGTNGDKAFYRGGNRGLTFSEGALDSTGPVIVVEGMSDAAAGMALGLAVVGRPSNLGGIDHLAVVLEDVPVDRQIIFIGERDEKPDGRWPGKEGAIKSAGKLGEKLGRPVEWSLPPGDAKDLRQWYVAEAAQLTNPKEVFLDGLQPETPPSGAKCSRSSISTQKTYRAKGTTRPSLPSYSGFNCNGVAVVQKHPDGSGRQRVSPVACRRRFCVECGPVWLDRHRLGLLWCVSQSETLYVAETPRKTWKTFYRRIQRAGGGEYARIEASASGVLTVITTVAVDGAEPIDADEAKSLVMGLLGTLRPVNKPIVYSKGWRISVSDAAEPSDIDDAEKWETVRVVRRRNWRDIIANMQKMGIPYEVCESNNSMMIYWQMPEGADEEATYDGVTGITPPVEQPKRNEWIDAVAVDRAELIAAFT